jgi:hypothetical protein
MSNGSALWRGALFEMAARRHSYAQPTPVLQLALFYVRQSVRPWSAEWLAMLSRQICS